MIQYLDNHVKKCEINTELLCAAIFKPDSLNSPGAWIGHIPFAAWLIREFSPSIFVELGTHTGNSYFSFCQSVKDAGITTKCFAVDTWEGDEHSGKYSEEIFKKVSIYNSSHYHKFSSLLRMKFDDALAHFPDGSVEMLHIDGLHTYEAVKHDYETWLPKLAPGAIILFHDTNVRERDFGVWRLWNELKAIHPSNLEFYHSYGLGVLQLGSSSKADKLGWLEKNNADKRILMDYFTALGSHLMARWEIIELKQAVADRDVRISYLEQAVADRDVRISYLEQAVADRDVRISYLEQAVADRDVRISYLEQAVADRDVRISYLEQAVADRDVRISYLEQAVADRDVRISYLEQAVADRDVRISYLEQAVADRDIHIQEVFKTMSWRITMPLRFIKRLFF
ncbi:class I SAM-dependent methyltransferase [Polynucleobacter paneuropaeus]|nr:class I SAM-dependent methyltransferase [Polynucleobacter paneuropaeus]